VQVHKRAHVASAPQVPALHGQAREV
jgi:hypothetical protein